MQRPTRKWRKRRRRGNNDDDDGHGDGFSLLTRDDSLPIDKNKRRWFGRLKGVTPNRAAFGGLRWLPPWLCGFLELLHVSTSLVPMGTDWVGVLACLLAVKGLLQSSRSYQQWMWYSCYTGLFLAVFWLYYMMRFPKFRWDIIWLPFGPLSGAGICLYVDHLLEESPQDINRLRSSMYNYKAM